MRPVILSRPENTAVGLAILFGGGSTMVSLLGGGPSEAGCCCGRCPAGWRRAGRGLLRRARRRAAARRAAAAAAGSGCATGRRSGRQAAPAWRRNDIAAAATRDGGRSGTSAGGRCGGLPNRLSKILGNCASAGDAASRPAIVSSARSVDRAISRLWSASSGCRLRQETQSRDRGARLTRGMRLGKGGNVVCGRASGRIHDRVSVRDSKPCSRRSPSAAGPAPASSRSGGARRACR